MSEQCDELIQYKRLQLAIDQYNEKIEHKINIDVNKASVEMLQQYMKRNSY